MLTPEMETLINDAYEADKIRLKEDIALLPSQKLFEAFMQLNIKQNEENDKIFEPGYLPKNYHRAFLKCLSIAGLNWSPKVREVFDLHECVELCNAIQATFDNNLYVFVKLVCEAKDKPAQVIYSVCKPSCQWHPLYGFKIDDGIDFKVTTLPAYSEATTKIQRIPCNQDFVCKIIQHILDPENWEIQETDPIEHTQEPVFLEDKAFSKYFTL